MPSDESAIEAQAGGVDAVKPVAEQDAPVQGDIIEQAPIDNGAQPLAEDLQPQPDGGDVQLEEEVLANLQQQFEYVKRECSRSATQNTHHGCVYVCVQTTVPTGTV